MCTLHIQNILDLIRLTLFLRNHNLFLLSTFPKHLEQLLILNAKEALLECDNDAT